MADIIIITGLVLMVFFILRGQLKRIGRGKCGGGCSGCSCCKSCTSIGETSGNRARG